MTVKEIIAILKVLPQDAEVRYFDTWWDCEGWEPETYWDKIDEITYDVEDNAVHLK
jgi:hypothetical protein